MRHALIVVLTLAALTAVAAGAQAEELEEYLQRSADSEFTGRQIVACNLGGISAVGAYDVVRSHGMTMLARGDHSAIVGDGKMADDAGFSTSRIADWSAWRLSDRYSLLAPSHTMFMGHEVAEVSVVEGALLRTRLLLDTTTWAPLLSEVYDGSGEVYCLTAMLEFEQTGSLPTPADPPSGYEMVPTATSTNMPMTAAGYWQADSYLAGTMTHAFYTDGLFSFSVFEAEGRPAAGALEDGQRFQVSGAEYRRSLYPGEVRVLWRTPGRTYVLVGDLPPDHLDDVLAQLPRPRNQNVFARLWRGIFG